MAASIKSSREQSAAVQMIRSQESVAPVIAAWSGFEPSDGHFLDRC